MMFVPLIACTSVRLPFLNLHSSEFVQRGSRSSVPQQSYKGTFIKLFLFNGLGSQQKSPSLGVTSDGLSPPIK
eukprot:m.20095 g.20095  ORF g.20095 m.20095 type:complete len:73 (+) comp8543_c0_seq1:3520-3738(+)